MANPSEVKDNVGVISDMVGALQGVVDLVPAGQTGEGIEQQQQQTHNNDSSSGATKKKAVPTGLSAEEQTALSKIREVLQPVKDVTWPVGLTDNRK